MAEGIYAALAGAVAEQRALEVAANNLANVATTGFKREVLSFREILAGENSTSRQVVVEPQGADFTQGSLARTGGALDAAILGDGFFAVQTPQGERYTRAGAFTLKPDGTLVTASGYPVLGDGGPIRVDTDKRVSLGPDGSLTSGTDVVGKIRLVDFPNKKVLERAGENLWRSTDTTAPRRVETNLEPGVLEQSNVNAIEGMTELIMISRAYEGFNNALQTYRDIDQRTANDLAK
jgi:flagellar basal-body rod protein FlgF